MALTQQQQHTFHPVLRLGQLGLVLLVVISGLLGLTGCHAAETVSRTLPGMKPPVSLQVFQTPGLSEPQALYEEAWQAIGRDYGDPGFNGQVWEQWHHRYDGRLKDDADAGVAIETMLASLHDEYTRYLSSREYREQSLSIDAELVGVGMQIAVRDGKLYVVAPLEETPAARAGLRPLDEITTINGQSAHGITVEDAADKIRGPHGSTVRLGFARKGRKPFEKVIERQSIHVKSVFEQPVKAHPELGYVRLNSFISESASREMRQALMHQRYKQGLILDLRGNYGGLFSNAVEVTNLFLPNQLIVRVEGRDPSESMRYFATARSLYQGPLAILIDGGTASASEIVSGALKDHHRAALIGTHTFGKGLVQKIVPLSGGAGVNITIARYLTPNGTDIHHKGIQPTVKTTFTESDLRAGRDPQLQSAIDYLVKTLKTPKSQMAIQPLRQSA